VRAPIVTRSFLRADQDHVWARVSTFAGVNDEFFPLFRMTAPRAVREQGLGAVEVGQRVCRSWVLLLGFLPVDYDDIVLERLDPPNGFLERSTMLSQRRWEHERMIVAVEDGCIVTDRIGYEPRLPVPDSVLRWLYGSIFRHRHRRLRRRFGGHPLAPALT
jgi:ligand-binding SRPBCC domain-containing protein